MHSCARQRGGLASSDTLPQRRGGLASSDTLPQRRGGLASSDTLSLCRSGGGTGEMNDGARSTALQLYFMNVRLGPFRGENVCLFYYVRPLPWHFWSLSDL